MTTEERKKWIDWLLDENLIDSSVHKLLIENPTIDYNHTYTGLEFGSNELIDLLDKVYSKGFNDSMR